MYFEIYGYDDNWDMGGDHRSPKLCIVKANSKAQAEEYAMTLTGFYSSWHDRGCPEVLPCRECQREWLNAEHKEVENDK